MSNDVEKKEKEKEKKRKRKKERNKERKKEYVCVRRRKRKSLSIWYNTSINILKKNTFPFLICSDAQRYEWHC
jgi:hypothetical protein